MVPQKYKIKTIEVADELAVVELDGHQIMRMLENGVSQYPRLEGRFPQVSGLRFEFDAERAAGQRVIPGSVVVAGQPLAMDGRVYTLATKEYLIHGNDGYDVFQECRILRSGEECPVLPTVVRHHFTVLSVLNGFRGKDKSSHLSRLATMVNNIRQAAKMISPRGRRHESKHSASSGDTDGIKGDNKEVTDGDSTAADHNDDDGGGGAVIIKMMVATEEEEKEGKEEADPAAAAAAARNNIMYKLCPRVENRIICKKK